MDRILPARANWPLYAVEASRRIEAVALSAAEASGAQRSLMQRAGAAVSRLAMAVAPHAQRIWVAAGPGNNGGDGLEAALQLRRLGKQVEVTLAADTAYLPREAAASLQRAQDAGVGILSGSAPPAPLGRQELAIDALLGLGGTRPPEGNIAALISRLNSLPCTVLAVDLPSGLSADTGQPLGTLAVVATHTLSLLTLKPGLFTGAGRDHAGTVWLELLGTDLGAEPPDAHLQASIIPSGSARPSRHHAQHKGSFGDVIVVGGAAGMVGAAVLAARAAHAAGAGRVWVASLDTGAPALDFVRPELMWRPGLAGIGDDALAQATVVCGCGGGDRVAAVLPRLLTTVTRLVLDADALNAIASDAALFSALRARADRGQASILTPHPLEAARLLGCSAATVQMDRLAAARLLVERCACVLVLKGSGSVTAAPRAIPRINASGNAALATAGTGDVLAGWLAGCWSADRPIGDGDPTSSQGSAFEAASAAVWRHGHAAETAGRPVLRASDLIEQMVRLQPA